MNPRFFSCIPLPESGEIVLSEQIFHHAVRVMRLRDGERVVLFDGRGGERVARLIVQGKRALANVEQALPVERESSLQMVLVQGLPAADKMDWIVQKAVELGVSGVIPLMTERSVLRLTGERAEKRQQHWQRIAVAACEQCGRNRIPQISLPVTLADWLRTRSGETAFILTPDSGQGLLQQPRPSGKFFLMIGPEAGWSDAESAACRKAGCIAVSLGPRVLRTETAGMAAMAALQAKWGDLGTMDNSEKQHV